MAKREHGTSARYNHGPDENDVQGKGCRCDPCLAASRRALKRRRIAALQGRPPVFTDAKPVRAHVRELHYKHGLSMPALAAAVGMSQAHMRVLLGVDPSSRRLKRVKASTAAAVLAIQPGAVSNGKVPVLGSQRRLRGLCALGFTTASIAPHVGISAVSVSRIISAPKDRLVFRETAEKIAANVDRLAVAGPQSFGVPEPTVKRMQTIARAKGWVSLLAWDDPDKTTARPKGAVREAAHVG